MGRVSAARRPKGNIRERGNSLQVRYFAGRDPVTGKDVYLNTTIKGLDAAAYKRAEDTLAEFRTQVNKQRSVGTSVPLSHALDEWMRTSDIEDSTRKGYAGYIERTVKPAIGSMPVKKISPRVLESLSVMRETVSFDTEAP